MASAGVPGASVAQTIFAGRQMLTFGMYFKNGIDSDEGDEAWRYLWHTTDGGKILYVVGADWNATPEEVSSSRWGQKFGGLECMGMLRRAPRAAVLATTMTSFSCTLT